MLLSNKLVYGNRQCGNKVARQSLDIGLFVNPLHGVTEQDCIARFELKRNGISEDGACWIRRLLSPRQGLYAAFGPLTHRILVRKQIRTLSLLETRGLGTSFKTKLRLNWCTKLRNHY